MQAPKKTANVRDALRAKASAPLETGTAEAPDQTAIDDARKPLPSRRAGMLTGIRIVGSAMAVDGVITAAIGDNSPGCLIARMTPS